MKVLGDPVQKVALKQKTRVLKLCRNAYLIVCAHKLLCLDTKHMNINNGDNKQTSDKQINSEHHKTS